MNATKVLTICGKTSDCFSMEGYDKDKNSTGFYQGYVPDFFPDEHYGDYMLLNIDVETGQILNWNKPSQTVLDQLLIPEKED